MSAWRASTTPATLSKAAIDGLLRGELGFTGVVVTDALEMRAVSATVGVEEGAVRALEAGADALCLGHDLGAEPVQAAVVEAALGPSDEALRRPPGASPSLVGRSAVWTRLRVGSAWTPRGGRSARERSLARPPLVVELEPESSIAAGNANHGLGDALQRLR